MKIHRMLSIASCLALTHSSRREAHIHVPVPVKRHRGEPVRNVQHDAYGTGSPRGLFTGSRRLATPTIPPMG